MNTINSREKTVLGKLFELGETTVNQLAKETLINRTSLYPILEKLLEKGLVSKIQMDGRTFFRAISEEDFFRWIENSKKKAEAEASELGHWIKSQKENSDGSLASEVSYFEGEEGVKNIFADTWRNNPEKVIYGFTDYDEALDTFGEFFLKSYIPQRIKHGIKFQGIIPESERAKKEAGKQKQRNNSLRMLKSLQKLGIEINIYDSKITLVDFNKKKPSGIIIKNEKIAKALKKIFDYMWGKGKSLK